MKYTVLLTVGEDDLMVAYMPALPGCMSQGRTKEDALAAVREAAEGWLEAQVAKGAPIPTDDIEPVVDEIRQILDERRVLGLRASLSLEELEVRANLAA